MGATYTPHEFPTDGEGRVNVDVPCTRCGYNLRSLAADGTCPECGTLVEESARRRYLRFADPSWVRGLAGGAGLLLICLIGLIIVPLLYALVVAGTTLPGVHFGQCIIGPLVLAFSIVGIVGLVRLSRREPAEEALGTERLTARSFLRLCLWLLAAIVAVGMAGFLVVTSEPDMTDASGFELAYITWWAGLTLTLLMITLATLRLLRHLFGRLPNPGLVRFASVEFWGFLLTGLLAVAAMVTTMYATVVFSRTFVMPGPPGAAPTSAPTTAATTAPALVSFGYVSTTAPSTVTTPPNRIANPPIVALLLAATIVSGVTSCVTFVFVVGALVLFALARRAFLDAAAAGEAITANEECRMRNAE